ncbi:uncharacterized protein [Antedon mediterranea]|uniref:uncharacterized protein isoform X2 n=1 Tax=Antedon mediterranea TaxID=105859 RepID=UPI003AF9FA24
MTLKDILYVFIIGITVWLDKCSAVTVSVDDVDVAEGSEARITCNIVPASSGAVPVVAWYNVTNGANDLIANYQGGFGTVEPGYTDRFSVENDTTLVITNTHRSDSGTYQCSANLVGDSPSIDDDICTLTVNYLDKPEINFLTLVTEGDEVVMTCVVDSSPEAMCNFIKDGDVLPHDGSCTFTIPSVSRTDGGSYKCEADNGVGNKQKSDNRNLEVQFKPVANDDNDINDQIVSPGETVTKTFSGTANPSDLTYLWTTDLPGNEDAVNNGSTFTVKVSESEVDGAFYFVNLTVTNSIGSTTYSAKITISETPPTTQDPVVTDEDTVNTAAIAGGVAGAAALFIIVGIVIYLKNNKPEKPCRMKVLPSMADVSTNGCLQVEFTPPNGEKVQHFDWYKSDKNGVRGNFLVRSGDVNSRWSVADDGSLKIPNVKEDDDGYYLCEMTTSEQVFKHHATFTVTNGNKNEKSLKKNKSDGEPAIEMEEGKTPLVRYEAKGGDLYTEVNLKKKKPVESEAPGDLYAKVEMDKKTKKPERPAQVDKQLRNVEELQYADLDLISGLPKGGASNKINHPDPDTTYASIQPTKI